ncbi:BTAD domain-containing putative transcriptional regulator [Streptomyces aurantiogriseus]|uniref:BTAD domain-containing putative transcriptional regulator n=1 Tax=Streptomyces aurantiogriseus TaxID=66870 RepID=UPI00167A847D|nr:BTAD domain-containing putative transcriptional regulator [Streptomyces aurantiogriseus]
MRQEAVGHRAAEQGRAAHGRPSGAWSFGLLGALEVNGPTGPVALGPPQRRVLLLRLLTEDGWPVSVERLCEDLWEGRPPSAALSSLRAHISRLRSALAVFPESGTGMLTYTAAGYALHVTREQRDAGLFEDAVQYAHELARERKWAQARAETEKALSLWRGRPYADADGRLFVQRETNRLSELRWSARELQAGLLLEEGEITRSLAVAEEIVSGNPLREASWAVLLRGLYLAGRAGEALRRFEAVRRLLAEDLGTDPGPALQRVHMAVLRHDTGALQPAARASVRLAPASDVTDRTASPGRVRLAGREAELTRLTGLLSAARAGSTRWAVVSGRAGTGKTRLLEALGAEAEQRGFEVRWVRHPKKRQAPLAAGRTPVTRSLGCLAADEGGHQNLPGSEHGKPDTNEVEGSRPVLCLIDDVQGATPVVMNELASRAALVRDRPLLVVCAVNPGDEPGTEELLATLARCDAERFELQPLTPEDIAGLLRSNGDTGGAGAAVDDPRSEAAALHQLTGGNAFFLAELLRLPAARRAGPRLTIPAAVTSVVRARLRALAPEVRQVLEIAAVTGEELDVPELAVMASLPRAAVLSGLDVAVEVGLVTWSAGGTPREPGAYRFSCGLVREVLRAGLSRARSHEVHATVYRVLAARPGSSVEAVAEHAVAAGPLVDERDLSQAALQAGYACLKRNDVDEAREWLARALAGPASGRGRSTGEWQRSGATRRSRGGSDGAATGENNVVHLPVRRA